MPALDSGRHVYFLVVNLQLSTMYLQKSLVVQPALVIYGTCIFCTGLSEMDQEPLREENPHLSGFTVLNHCVT